MEIFIILMLLLLNGVFAMCEIALVSSKKSRLEHKAAKGSKGAAIALNLLKEPEKFLSTVQIGITLIGVVAGAYGGVAFAEDLSPYFQQVSWLAKYAEQTAFIVVVTIITYFSLVIGELVPKTLAMNNPEGITIAFASFMKVFSMITYPLAVFLTFSTKLILKLFRVKENQYPPITEEELKYMIDTGSQHGIIEKQEGEIMHSVFRFGDRKANTVMTARKEIQWINIDWTLQEILNFTKNSNHSKYPVCKGSLDKIIGVINIKDLIDHDENNDITMHLQDPVYFPENTPALKMLDVFRKGKIHISFVVNEFGGTKGLITLHDLIENILGDLPELGDKDEVKVIKREDGSLLLDGDFRIEDLKNLLKLNVFPQEASYTTLAGFMLNEFHCIPKAGDYFEYKNYRFEIVDMDNHKIDKVLVKASAVIVGQN